MEKCTATEDDYIHIAQDILDVLSPHHNTATLLLLCGDLGAGKTTFVKSLARELGVTERITSPTFVLLKRFNTEHKTFRYLVHLDAYRIEEERELDTLKWEALLNEENTLVVIEWPERIEDHIPHTVPTINFEIQNENSRTLSFSNFPHKFLA